jgi:hypothetical protein
MVMSTRRRKRVEEAVFRIEEASSILKKRGIVLSWEQGKF